MDVVLGAHAPCLHSLKATILAQRLHLYEECFIDTITTVLGQKLTGSIFSF
jgi:hypothetical protein